MKAIILSLVLTTLFTSGIFAQNFTEKDFSNYVDAQLNNNAHFPFICSKVDTAYTEDISTGEFIEVLFMVEINFIRSNDKIEINGNNVIAKFYSETFNAFGEISGKIDYTFVFNKAQDSFVVESIADNKERIWFKKDDCWTY